MSPTTRDGADLFCLCDPKPFPAATGYSDKRIIYPRFVIQTVDFIAQKIPCCEHVARNGIL